MRQELWSLGVLLYILLTGEYPFDTAVGRLWLVGGPRALGR